jgi:hypothetical protein
MWARYAETDARSAFLKLINERSLEPERLEAREAAIKAIHLAEAKRERLEANHKRIVEEHRQTNAKRRRPPEVLNEREVEAKRVRSLSRKQRETERQAEKTFEEYAARSGSNRCGYVPQHRRAAAAGAFSGAAGAAGRMGGPSVAGEAESPSRAPSLSPFLPPWGRKAPTRRVRFGAVVGVVAFPATAEAAFPIRFLLPYVRGVRFFEPSPSAGRDDAHDVGQRRLAAPAALPHVDQAEPLGRPEGVPHRGPANARPGRNRIDV